MAEVFFIAEAGVNHNGKVEIAKLLVEKAKTAGADAVKFQSFNSDELVVKKTETAPYQAEKTAQVDQHLMLKSLELSPSEEKEVFNHCKKLNIEYMSTPFDIDSAKRLMKMGMRKIKISSGEITNLKFLRDLGSIEVPLILSTGMSTTDEINIAIKAINPKERLGLSLLHCTSEYPVAIENINLLAMKTMMDKFNFPVGYSDHSVGYEVPIAAAALGAEVIEKHFTLDKSMRGPDHAMSTEPEELASIIRSIRAVKKALGSPTKKPTVNEENMKLYSRRSLITEKSMKKGQSISHENLGAKRPGVGISPADFELVLKRKLKHDKSKGEILFWSDFD